MNEKTKPIYLRPFKRFCMTIGELPTSYIESMTYYEMLLWLIKYLQDTVIPAVNNNAEALEEVQKALVDLTQYVDDYFDNLDLQKEIDKTLDEMIESGKLAEIIAEFLNSNAVLGFNNIASLKLADNLVDGAFVKTYGSENLNDGFGSLYKIRLKTPEDVIDEIFIISLHNDTLVAEKIKDFSNILSFDTILDLSNATNVFEGSNCYCLGELNYNDGNGAFYKIRTKQAGDVIDNYLLVKIENNDTLVAERIIPDSEIPPKKYLLIGDSYAEGYSPDGSVTPFPQLFKNRMNLTDDEIVIAYRGGIGFGRTGYKIESLIETLSSDEDITDVVILAGYNDRGISFNDIKTGIETCSNLIKNKFPKAILHIGQIGGSTTPNNIYALYGVTNAYIRACTELNIKYIYNIEFTLHDYFNSFSSDGFHPNQSGQSSIAYSLQKYFINGKLDIIFPLTDYNASAEPDYTLPNTFSTRLTMKMNNDITYVSNKYVVTIGVKSITMNGNGTLYKIGTTIGGYIVGSIYYTNSINMGVLVKTNNVFKKVNAILNFDNGGFYIRFLDLNDAGSNYAIYNNVTEIIIPPFEATFVSELC